MPQSLVSSGDGSLSSAFCSGIMASAVLRELGVVAAGREGHRGHDGHGEYSGCCGGKSRMNISFKLIFLCLVHLEARITNNNNK